MPDKVARRQFFAAIPEDLRRLGWRLDRVDDHGYSEQSEDNPTIKVSYARPKPQSIDRVDDYPYFVARESTGMTWEELRMQCVEEMSQKSVDR